MHRPVAAGTVACGRLLLAIGLVTWVVAPVAAATTTNATSVATDQSFSGFTVGAAVVAVLVGGAYWYYRH
jgi:hypothetical protein